MATLASSAQGSIAVVAVRPTRERSTLRVGAPSGAQVGRRSGKCWGDVTTEFSMQLSERAHSHGSEVQ